MNQKLRDQLKRLDYNRDGKINVADAEQVLQDHMEGSMFRAACVGAVVGGFVVGIIAAIL